VEAHILNFPTRPYNPDQPDKFRIDPHDNTIPYDWSIRDG
jgi:dTDP-4-dehydrorhamnose 3,5-epimerase